MKILTQIALSIGIAVNATNWEWFMSMSPAYRLWAYMGLGFALAPILMWAYPDNNNNK